MKILSLINTDEVLVIAHERFDPRREGLEIADGRGGYRYVRPEEARGKVLVRFDSKAARKVGLKIVGTQVFCPALEGFSDRGERRW